MDRVFRFEAQVIETVPSYETFPILDDNKKLVGAFIRLFGDQVRGWVAGNDSPVALRVSTGDKFWFTPKLGEDGSVTHAVVSEQSTGVTSVQITMAEEEKIPLGDAQALAHPHGECRHWPRCPKESA